jgi:hypothetical protein
MTASTILRTIHHEGPTGNGPLAKRRTRAALPEVAQAPDVVTGGQRTAAAQLGITVVQ